MAVPSIVAALLVGLWTPYAEATTTTTISSKALRQQLSTKQAELKQATSKLEALQAELDSIAEQQNLIEVRLAELEEGIAAAEQEIARSQEDLAKVRATLEQRLVGLYKESSSGLIYANVLLDGADLTSVLESLDTLSTLAAEDQRLFDQVEKYLEDQQAGMRDLQQKQAEQRAEQQALAEVQEAAADKFAAADQTYRTLKSQIKQLKADIAKADAAAAAAAAKAAAAARQRALQRMARQQAQRWSNSSGGTIQSPPFTFPVDGPHSYINSWGFPRSGGTRVHKGTDIMAARGTRLVACAPGVVSGVNRSDTGLGGITVHIKSDNGCVYYYAHLDGVASGLYVGMRVNGGSLVGYVGNSGNARGGACHLHFGMQPGGGITVNPYATLRYYDD